MEATFSIAPSRIPATLPSQGNAHTSRLRARQDRRPCMSLTIQTAIADFGAKAKAKLANPSATGATDDAAMTGEVYRDVWLKLSGEGD